MALFFLLPSVNSDSKWKPKIHKMEEVSASTFDLSTTCRLCLSKGVATLDIFAFSTVMMDKVVNAIMKCAPVQIMRCDEMPNLICNSCNTQLEKSHQFQQQIVQSDQTLQRYLQRQRTSNKQIRVEGSIQGSSEDSLIHNTSTDIKIKREPSEFQDESDINVNLQEDIPSNITSVYKRNEEIYLKSEIKEEPIDDYSSISTECIDNSMAILSGSDGSKDSCKIKEEPTDVNSITMECTAHLLDTSSDGGQGIKVEPKISEIEKQSHNFTPRPDLTENFTKRDDGTKNTSKIFLKYKCELCNKGFAFLSKLNFHKCGHTGKRLYQCDVCNKSFSDARNLAKHRRVHTGEKPYQCDVCNKCFTQSQHLKNHQLLHTDEKPYQCDVCKKGFTRSIDLQKHQRIHTGEKPYQCDVCNMCFSESRNLKKHQRLHTGETPYLCDVCNKSFSDSGYLKKHQLVHTGETPYRCDVCNKCFATHGSMARHQRIHTGEKPYQCDICHKCFRESAHLKYHQRVHTGEKPYQCDVCNKCFSRSDILRIHERIHTGEKPN